MEKTQRPRRIILDLFQIRNRNVGLGEFAYQLGSHISDRAPKLLEQYNVEFTFIVPTRLKGCFGDNVKYTTIGFPRVKLKLLKNFSCRYDIYHAVHQFGFVHYMKHARKNIVTVHDINFMYEKSGAKLNRYIERFRQKIENYDVVSYISEFARKDVLDNFSNAKDGRVIYNGVADLTSVCGDFSKYGLQDNGYLLHVSSLLPKKNVHKIAEMMRYLPEEKLVVVGDLSTDYAHKIQQNIKMWGLTNVVMLNHISHEDKAELYRHCKAFLFPSVCEGFGLPPIEAMHFGKPVFLSKLTSLPEIGGDVAYYYDSLVPEKMAEMTRVGLAGYSAKSDYLSQQIKHRACSFDWNVTADSYIQLYLDTLKDI